jgi:hypothetical protein
MNYQKQQFFWLIVITKSFSVFKLHPELVPS